MVENLNISQISALEPGRKFLGRIKFTNIKSGPIIVKSFGLSKTTSDKIEVRRMAEVAYFPGYIIVDPITLTVYFFKSDLMEFIREFYGKVYKPNKGTLGRARDIKTDAILEVLKPDGTVSKTITLKNAWIYKVDLGNIDWTTNVIITATISLRYDKAIVG
jgi:hypothetical protein